MHLGDHRLRQVADRLIIAAQRRRDRRSNARPRPPPARIAVISRRSCPAQNAARARGSPRAPASSPQPLEGGLQRRDHRIRQRVELVGALSVSTAGPPRDPRDQTVAILPSLAFGEV
jgi:hypothetical protein